MGMQPDAELLYLCALFDDTGRATPSSEVEQRFELDGADHARRFLVDRGFPGGSAETVWPAIALHTTPASPAGWARRSPPPRAASSPTWSGSAWPPWIAQVDAVLAAHPRGNFKTEFLQAFVDGLEHRPDTTYGT
jgi:hypothetical protein